VAKAGDPRLFYGCAGQSKQENDGRPWEDKLIDNMVVIGSVSCLLQLEVHVGGQRVSRT
jgi:hypothetical protein